jgi:hypothetical protein
MAAQSGSALERSNVWNGKRRPIGGIERRHRLADAPRDPIAEVRWRMRMVPAVAACDVGHAVERLAERAERCLELRVARIAGGEIGVGKPELLDLPAYVPLELPDDPGDRRNVPHPLVLCVRFEERRVCCLFSCQHGHFFVRVTAT